MRDASSKRSKNKRARQLDRPFEPAVLERANTLAMLYRIVLSIEEDVGFVGNCLEMPLVMADGRSADACVAATREAIVSVIAHILEKGQVPPAPVSEQRRDQQLNLRLTLEEKMAIEEAARQQGFRGASDFVRTRSLEGLL